MRAQQSPAERRPRRKTCRYWRTGNCTHGDNCKWAHPLGEVASQTSYLGKFPIRKLQFFVTRIVKVSHLGQIREGQSSRRSNQSTTHGQDQSEEHFDLLASLELAPTPDPTKVITLEDLLLMSGFSHVGLIEAITQPLSRSEIARYLSNWNEFEVREKINLKYSDYPPLFYASHTNDCELVRLLIEMGARHNVCGKNAMPLLPWVILQDHPQSSHVVRTLLSLGCNANTIPSDMFEDIMRYPNDVVAEEDLSEMPWCTPTLRVELARCMNLSHRYLLNKASKRKAPSPRKLQTARHLKISGLFGMPYFIIGQEIATDIVCSSVINHLCIKSSHPLVMAFVGPPGHGKTELALKMGELLSTDILVIDCTEMVHETDLFGPKAPYRGHELGSPLNNYLSSEHGKRTVVFLDEFDKTTEEVRQSLLIVFDQGTPY